MHFFANIIFAGEESTLGRRKRAVFFVVGKLYVHCTVSVHSSNNNTFKRKHTALPIISDVRYNIFSKANAFTKNQFETGSRS